MLHFRQIQCSLQGDKKWSNQSKVEKDIEKIMYSTFSGDFLGPYMRTFDDLSHVLIFVHPFELQWVSGYLGPFWAIFYNHTWAQINEQKLKHDLNHQMSAHMVKQNHQRKLNT